MGGIDWLSASKKVWRGWLTDSFIAAVTLCCQTGVGPRASKHGQVCWQTSKGGCTQPRTHCPCNGKLPFLPLKVCNQLRSPLCGGTVIYRKTCLFAVSVRCLRDGLFALNIKRLPSIKMNKYFLTYRGEDAQEIPLSNLSVRSERHSRQILL